MKTHMLGTLLLLAALVLATVTLDAKTAVEIAKQSLATLTMKIRDWGISKNPPSHLVLN